MLNSSSDEEGAYLGTKRLCNLQAKFGSFYQTKKLDQSDDEDEPLSTRPWAPVNNIKPSTVEAVKAKTSAVGTTRTTRRNKEVSNNNAILILSDDESICDIIPSTSSANSCNLITSQSKTETSAVIDVDLIEAPATSMNTNDVLQQLDELAEIAKELSEEYDAALYGKTRSKIKRRKTSKVTAVVLNTRGGTTIVVNILGCVNLLFFWHFNRRLYRRITKYIYWLTISHVVFLCQWWSSIKLILYVDADVYDNYFGKEHAVCLMNHRYEIDYLSIVVLSDQLGVSGNLKACIKNTVKYVPVVGWCLYLVEYVFLTRSFVNDEDTIRKQIHDIADNPYPVWLIFYPEGTRITSQKHYNSRQYARDRGLRPLRYHLQPRTKGFLAGIPAVKSRFAAIYDTELYIENCLGNVSFFNLFSGKSYVARMYIKRIPVQDLPDNENEQRQYLLDVFQNKDRIMHNFVNKCYNFETIKEPKITEPIQFDRNPVVLCNFIFWCTIFCYPFLHTLITAIIRFDLTAILSVIAAYIVALVVRLLLFWTIKLHTQSFECCEYCNKVAS